MGFIIGPTWDDLFNEEAPEPIDLISDIPSDVVIRLLCFIHAQITLSNNSFESHLKLWHFLTENIDPYFSELSSRLDKFIKRHRGMEVRIFGYHYVLDFIEHEVQNYRDILNFKDTSPEQSMNILKSYFIFAQKYQIKAQEKVDEVEYDQNERFFFQKRTWPLMIEQLEINHVPHLGILPLKSFVFLQFFYKSSKYRQYVDQFLNHNAQETIWHYIIRLMNIIKISKDRNNNNDWFNFKIELPPSEYKSIFDAMTLDIKDINENKENFKNYKGLREFPLFKYENHYYVFNWHFLQNKLYTGLVFDFYKNSGIKLIFPKLPDFLSMIGSNISEKSFFQKIFNNIFNKKYSILYFDMGDGYGYPDMYFRSGNDIILVELKDSMLPASIINNYSYEAFTNHLREKFIVDKSGKPKGALQILEQIKKINTGGFAFDDFKAKRLKIKNLKIYPVIVYTNFEYSMSGVEDYVRHQFELALEEYTSDKKDSWNITYVSGLVMINFDFFMKIAIEENRRFDFPNLIKNYNSNLKNRFKRFKKNATPDNAIKLFPGFENVNDLYKKESQANVSKMFKILDIEFDLPNE